MSSSADNNVRVRLAPSPTGDPHVGTAYIGLINYVFARSKGGSFILRIEDTDRERSMPEYETAILKALEWVGLNWDEGPERGGHYGPYRQSERLEKYHAAAEKLLASGHAYRCFCTPERLSELRELQRKTKRPPGYDGHCRGVDPAEAQRRADSGEPHVVRLAVPEEGETSFDDLIRGTITVQNYTIDDQVLLKSDGFPTYHLANVVDDEHMKITHVIRAEEWVISTPKHILLYDAFGWEPPKFAHMPLLRNADRSKISKRKNPVSLEWYREQGFLPEALINFLGLMGWSAGHGREIFTPEEMIQEFAWERVGKGAPVFDLRKLEWLNGEYIRMIDDEKLAAHLREVSPLAAKIDDDMMPRILPLVRERMKRLLEFDEMCEFFFVDKVEPDMAELVVKKRTPAESAEALKAALQTLENIEDWRTEPMEAACRQLTERIGWKVGQLFMTLRIAVTGKKVTPPLFESMEVLGREKSLERIREAIKMLENTAG